MILLLVFALVAGIATILSPCILPVLPVVLSGAVGGRGRPLGIVIGFAVSFVAAVMLVDQAVRVLGIPADVFRIASIAVLAAAGLVLAVPAVDREVEAAVSGIRLPVPNRVGSGFAGGLVTGAALGAVWTPCVGPILASVISLSLVGSVTWQSAAVASAYSLGTALSMFAIMLGGRKVFGGIAVKLPQIRRGFGVALLLVALMLGLGWDRRLQAGILSSLPDYANGITAVERLLIVARALAVLKAGTGTQQTANPAAGTPADRAPEIMAGGQWFNSKPLTLSGLRGKVVLIDFWTYSCVNCIRTLPYVERWYETYKDRGLVVIGVHTPEFEFEKQPGNVAKAIAEFKLTYPVVQDNGYATWNAYGNQYWPAKYFIDRNGFVRSTHFGEGGYDESETELRTLLAEGGTPLPTGVPHNPRYNVDAGTPETYLGYDRGGSLVSPEPISRDAAARYTVPAAIPDDGMAFGGTWTVGTQQAVAGAGARLALSFLAKDVYLVMAPVGSGGNGTADVYLDGKRVGDGQAGRDVHGRSVAVGEDRLYHIISLPSAGRHILELRFPAGGIGCYAFTFG
jgi:cytochrome c biogenesis protein CcdA/thiol-disulfide isomerase/thioredoxin